MTRLIHDKFAKDYLSELLSPLGSVNPGREVSPEVRQIDVYFTPTTAQPEYIEKLGLLGKMAITTALFEPFRNPVSVSEVLSCLSKLWEVSAEVERQSRRENHLYAERPKLWILTPTASKTLLNGFRAMPDQESWCRGIYFLGEYLRTAIVVIHQLPEIEETLWLRILGRGGVQQRAIASLTALPLDDPLRLVTLELVYQLQSGLSVNREQQLEAEDRELIMAIAPLFQEKLAAAKQEGIEQGLAQGRQEEHRSILENFLRVRLGKLDNILTALIPPLSACSTAEFTMLLLQLSAISVDDNGCQQARELLATSLLRMHFGQLEDLFPRLIPNLLALSPEELSILLSQLPQLSTEELLARLGDDGK